jgi:hypothetical protein
LSAMEELMLHTNHLQSLDHHDDVDKHRSGLSSLSVLLAGSLVRKRRSSGLGRSPQ